MRHLFDDVLCGKVQVCGFFVVFVEEISLSEGFTNSPLVAQNTFQGKSQIESTFILYNMPL